MHIVWALKTYQRLIRLIYIRCTMCYGALKCRCRSLNLTRDFNGNYIYSQCFCYKAVEAAVLKKKIIIKLSYDIRTEYEIRFLLAKKLRTDKILNWIYLTKMSIYG